ncbi:hypothetical protein ACSLGG_05805 [Bacillus mycoides]
MKISSGKWKSADGAKQFREKKNEAVKKNIHVRYSSQEVRGK